MQRPDPIEKFMGLQVEEMTPAELAAYVKTYLLHRYDIELPMDGVIERKTFEAFKRRYPDGKAGRIVQWVMMHHHGRRDGEYVSSSLFSAKMKWWTDKMFMELQHEQHRVERTEVGGDKLRAAFSDAGSMA